MKNLKKAAWGVFFVLLGAALAGKALGLFYFNIYFPGWWTLFIIIPCLIGLLEKGNRKSSLFGLGVGFFLLLAAQGMLKWYDFPRLMIAYVFISIGLAFIFRGEKREPDRSGNRYGEQGNDDTGYNGQERNKENSTNTAYGSDTYRADSYNSNTTDTMDTNSAYHTDSTGMYNGNYENGNYSKNNNFDYKDNQDKDGKNNNYNTNNNYNGRTGGRGYQNYYSLLGSRNVQFVNEVFTGAAITSILGNVQLDLRNAYIDDDVVINTTCILGGIDIHIPKNVKVVVSCTAVLGGVDSKNITPPNITAETRTVFIRGTCILGGVDIK